MEFIFGVHFSGAAPYFSRKIDPAPLPKNGPYAYARLLHFAAAGIALLLETSFL